MGLFSNPLGHAGYPPNPATATVVNSTVRAATLAEVQAGVLNDVYVSPATAAGLDAGLFASPPALGNVAPNSVAATLLSSTGNISLANTAAVTSIAIGNIAPSAARTTTMLGGNSAQNDTFNIFPGAPSANQQTYSVFGGAPSGGTQAVGFFTGNATGGAQSFSLLTGTRAGTANLATGAAAHTLNLLSSTGLLGVFGATAVVRQSQGALTNSVTAGGTPGTIANFTDLTTYATDAPTIRNDIYQLALALSGVITGLRNYGLLA